MTRVSGGVGAGGAKFGFGQVVLFIQSARVDVYVDLKISVCGARGSILVDHKPEGSVIESRAAGRRKTTCEQSGAAYCTEPAA